MTLFLNRIIVKLMSSSKKKRDLPLRWSFGTKLIIIFLTLTIIPTAATAYFNLSQSQSDVAKVTRENLVEISATTARYIEYVLIEHQRVSALLANESSIIQFLAASERERQALKPQVNRIFQNLTNVHPEYDAPGILDTNGIAVASLDKNLIGKDRFFREYFQTAIQGEPYISNILVGRTTRRPGIVFTNPIVTAKKEIVGIDIIWLKADTIWDIIDNVTIGKEGITYLVDQDGVIIGHPSRNLLFHSLGELTPEAATTISETIRFGTVKGTETPLVPESLDMNELATELASAQEPGTYRYYSPLDHRYHLVGYAQLEKAPWTVVIDLPESQFLAPLQQLARGAWGSVAIVLIITLTASILLALSVTRPISQLTEAAAKIEEGEPFDSSSLKDVVSGRDEIAHLGRVFTNMVLSLHRREEEIKRRTTQIKKFARSAVDRAREIMELKKRITQLERELKKEKGKK